MLRFLFVCLFTVSAVSVCTVSFGQDANANADDDSAVVASTGPDVGAAVGEVVDTVKAIGEAKSKGDKKGVWILVLGLISLALKFFVDLVSGPLVPKGKHLKWIAIILGAVGGGVTLLVSGLQGEIAGIPAVFMFLTGPLAIALHELGSEVPVLAQISNVLASLGSKD